MDVVSYVLCVAPAWVGIIACQSSALDIVAPSRPLVVEAFELVDVLREKRNVAFVARATSCKVFGSSSGSPPCFGLAGHIGRDNVVYRSSLAVVFFVCRGRIGQGRAQACHVVFDSSARKFTRVWLSVLYRGPRVAPRWIRGWIRMA